VIRPADDFHTAQEKKGEEDFLVLPEGQLRVEVEVGQACTVVATGWDLLFLPEPGFVDLLLH